MKIKKNRIHILRSLHVVARIRQENALSSEEFATRVRDVYARHHMLSHAPAEETVRAYLKGTRPIPFEPASPGALSYLLAIELAFPGTQAYFFHPLFNLLGPIRTSADRQAKLLLVRQTTIDMYRHQGEFEMAVAIVERVKVVDK